MVLKALANFLDLVRCSWTAKILLCQNRATTSGTSTCLSGLISTSAATYIGVLALSKSLLEMQGKQCRQCLLPRRSLRWFVDACHIVWLLLVHDQQSIQVIQQRNLGPLEEIVTPNKIEIILRSMLYLSSLPSEFSRSLPSPTSFMLSCS